MVFEPKENLHTRRMTKSKLPMLDRKVSTLCYYNIIYQQRMREQCFTNVSNGWIKQSRNMKGGANNRPLSFCLDL